MLERSLFHEPGACPCGDRRMAARLQPITAPQLTWTHPTSGICSSPSTTSNRCTRDRLILQPGLYEHPRGSANGGRSLLPKANGTSSSAEQEAAASQRP